MLMLSFFYDTCAAVLQIAPAGKVLMMHSVVELIRFRIDQVPGFKGQVLLANSKNLTLGRRADSPGFAIG